jgi:guanylate kinase
MTIPGCLYVIVAPSGAGKSSLVNALLEREPDVGLSISYTTRPPRPGDVSGREYFFVTLAEFQEMIDRHEFLEYAEVYGNMYGTSKRWIEKTRATGADVLLEIDWQGARSVRQLFPDMAYIYILPPSIEILSQRLKKRGKDTPSVIAKRVAAAREDLKHAPEADYVIINEDFNLALLDLQSIVRACRLKVGRQLKLHQRLLVESDSL